jgi:two-component system response regulator RegX3
VTGEPASAERHTVLIVEDEAPLSESIAYNLVREGFQAISAPDGERALALFRERHPSIVILDLMLPRLSGLDVCRVIRAESSVPIVILTAKNGEADKVAGLEIGADDYVTKPFSMRELVSRVRAHLRRSGMAVSPATIISNGRQRLSGGSIELDSERHEVFVTGDLVQLTPKEFDLLELFLSRKGRLLTRQFLIEEVWGPHYFGDTKTLDVHVKRLRQKLEADPHEPKHIVTVRGLGYKFLD